MDRYWLRVGGFFFLIFMGAIFLLSLITPAAPTRTTVQEPALVLPSLPTLTGTDWVLLVVGVLGLIGLPLLLRLPRAQRQPVPEPSDEWHRVVLALQQHLTPGSVSLNPTHAQHHLVEAVQALQETAAAGRQHEMQVRASILLLGDRANQTTLPMAIQGLLQEYLALTWEVEGWRQYEQERSAVEARLRWQARWMGRWQQAARYLQAQRDAARREVAALQEAVVPTPNTQHPTESLPSSSVRMLDLLPLIRYVRTTDRVAVRRVKQMLQGVGASLPNEDYRPFADGVLSLPHQGQPAAPAVATGETVGGQVGEGQNGGANAPANASPPPCERPPRTPCYALVAYDEAFAHSNQYLLQGAL